MDVWGYPHQLEYYREVAKDRRVHEYTELVDDMGFVLEHHAERWKKWQVRYGTACAEDFLTRKCAKPGRFVVHIYRLFPDSRKHLVSLRMKWQPARPKP
ncbi:hypothetical protein [Amycolatopsis sp. NPDC059021]|uniref:hypothetical protein n=1 Tax=Amycolatopsis sp. NPDC059021 TaxID=3346704 RepID=UPI00366AEB10